MARYAELSASLGTAGSTDGPATGPAEPRPASALLLGLLVMTSSARVRFALRAAELGTAAVVVAALASGTGMVGLACDALCLLAWLAWIVADERPVPVAAALAVMSASAGVAAGDGGLGAVFEGVAAAGAGFSFDLLPAAALACPALISFAIVDLIRGSVPSRPATLAIVGLAAMVSGGGRRQILDRVRQARLLTSSQERATIALREAELVAERNRMGREIHDVLAHTLSATSIQLTALDSEAAERTPHEELRARIAAIHDLVGEGLSEAREAVGALREDGPSLTTRLTRLCELHQASLDLPRPPPPIGPEASLTLYRVAQEALTNRDKHAPQSPVAIRLSADGDTLRLAIENDAARAGTRRPLGATGGGQGLIGLRDRLQLSGGTLDAGPSPTGWRVVAELPVP